MKGNITCMTYGIVFENGADIIMSLKFFFQSEFNSILHLKPPKRQISYRPRRIHHLLKDYQKC